MADGSSKIEGQYIRGLDIDKTIKGFGKFEYIFKNDCQQSTTPGDSMRWYSRTATDLTSTSPMKIANVAALAIPGTLEQTWTRHTSYTRKYMSECFISLEDIRTADIDVLAGQLRALVRAVTKQVDTRIWDIMTNSRAGSTAATTEPNLIVSSGAWDVTGTAACNPFRDILEAKRVIWTSGGYNPEGASLYLSPQDYTNLIGYMINVKGSNIPQYISAKIESGVVMQFLGLNVKVSPNVTADYAAVVIPNTACTWKTAVGLSSATEDKPGLGKHVVVWEDGEAILTDPKAVCLISNTQ